MKPQDKARQLKPYIYKAATSLPDEDALDAVELFPVWQTDTAYTVGVRVRYGDKLYKVWKQPTGAQDAYMTGDKVHYPTKDDAVYESTMDYNTYAPDVYGWVMV